MSTQTQDQNDQYIPDEVETGGASNRWRASGGKFRLGEGAEGTSQCEVLVGRLVRIGRYAGTSRDGSPYDSFEVDLIRNSDKVLLKTKFGTLSSTCSLMRGLLAASVGQLLMIECWEGKPYESGPGKGKKPTLLSVYEGVIKDGKVTKGKRLKDETDTGTGETGRDALYELIKNHPCYKDREHPADPNAPDTTSSLDHFKREVTEGSYWPKWCKETEPGYLHLFGLATDFHNSTAKDKIAVPARAEDVHESIIMGLRVTHAQGKAKGEPLPAQIQAIADLIPKANLAGMF
jgi:hypothetical protein